MAQTNYTYDQFVTDARNAGLYDQFSTADLNLARQNPDAGMQILNYKVDYGKAMTDEARALASQGAEDVRKKYGYSGGANGSGFQTLGGDTQSSIYSYDDVQKKIQESGVFMSAEDLALAQKNPDVGMSIVNNKIGYANATTPEEQSSFNQKNETLRSSYGGYTAGTDGGGFSVALPSPNDYVAPEAPKYANNLQGEVDDLWNKQKNYEDFSYDVAKPTYESQYDDEMQGLLSEILNRKAFSYDAESDPLYSQYKKQYLREGERASADALGAAAAMTGGIPSSYAATAAAQAGNHYAAQLTDKIPELYQLMYNQYMNEHQMKLNNLEAVGAMDDRYYGRYLDEVNQWNKDRNFEYGVYGDKYDRLGDQLKTVRDMQNTEYEWYLDDMDQYNKDREFGYKQHTDEIDHQKGEEEKAYNRAWNERAYADGRNDVIFNNGITEKELAANLGNTEWEKKVTLAELAKGAGDVETYNKIMQELLGSSFKPVAGFKTSESSGSKSGGNGRETVVPIDGGGGYPTFSFEGNLRVAHPSGYIEGEDYDALVERYGEDQLKEAGITKGSAPYKTYEDAVKHLKDNGKGDVAGYISPRVEWEKHKGNHISYEKYLEATVKRLMEE